MLSSIRVNVGFVFMAELLPKNKQSLYGTIFNNFDCFTYILATIYFWKISTDWFYFVLIGYLLNVWSFASSFFLPESPRFLIEQQKLGEASESLKTIAVWNKAEFDFNADEFRNHHSPQGSGHRDLAYSSDASTKDDPVEAIPV